MRRLVACCSLACLAALALAACSDGGTDPAPTPPALGRWAYTATVPTQTVGGSRAVTATLTLTYASADSIAGRWESTLYASQAAQLGFRNTDAYVLTADGRPGTGLVFVTHRLTGGGQALGCSGIHHRTDGNVPFACTLTYVGP
jgi:hypothetical protein